MKTVKHTLRFLTPAFLGDAHQNGRWRTPPIKHELRHWWRVAYAADHSFSVSVAEMRREEGLLFGNAWLEGEFCKSQVRIRLSRWDEGKLRSWQGLEQNKVDHPEVQRTQFKVGPHAYLGFGPLDGRGNTKLSEKVNAAIQAQEAATLAIACPESAALRLEHALWLMDRFGTLGGRARNGWGSYHLLPSPPGRGEGGEGLPLRDWHECLKFDWPHAIGQDEKGPLIWQTDPHADWKSLMRTLAIVKVGLRTQLRFTTGRGAQHPEDRHWLAYPVTNHDVRTWGAMRLPNQLRFKVRQTASGKLVGVIFHMPHLPPPAFNPDRAAIERVWRCVHEFLSALTQPPQKRRYCSMADGQALGRQKTQLDGVILERVSE